MMVSPRCGDNLVIKRFCVVFDTTHVVNEVFFTVLLLNELSNFVDIVSVPILPTARGCREAHGDNSWSDICQIQIEAFFSASSSFTRHTLPDSLF
jgi:hypothetical protein